MESDGYIKSGNCVKESEKIEITSSRYETSKYGLLKGVYLPLFL